MIDRITVLGGSSVYTPEFILSVISHNVNVREIVLVGRSEGKLSLVSRFCQRLLDKSGFPSTVTGTTDLAQGLEGADYVLNHVRVGGMSARLRDEKLPPKSGMIGDESLGAGGITNAMRTLPVVFEYAEAIEKVCPNTKVINLTNPMGICVEALIRHSNLQVIGVCDYPATYVKKIADLLRHDESELKIDYLGLNHMGWIQDVRVNGRSTMSRLLDCLDHHQDDGFDFRSIELFRMIPTQPLSPYFHQDEILRRQQATARYRAEVLHEAEKQILRLYEDEHLSEIPDLTKARNAVWYEDTIVPLIKAMESKEPHDIILCVRNAGSIRDLPDDCSVEVPVSVSRKGLEPRKIGNCPRFLKGAFISVKESDRLAIEAVKHKSYEYALWALSVNPFVPSLQAAREYLDTVMKEENLELH